MNSVGNGSGVGMTTPIHKLPVRSQTDSDNVGDINDPVVKEVLMEMQNAAPQQYQEARHSAPPPPPQQYYQPYNPPVSNIKDTNIIDYEIIKNTIIILVIVFAVFYSGLFAYINDYIKMEFLEKNETMVQFVLLFVGLYMYQYLQRINLL